MLEHVNEQIGDYHRGDDAVPVVLVPVVVHLEDVVIGEGLLAFFWWLGQRLFQSSMIEDRLEAVELSLFRQEEFDAARPFAVDLHTASLVLLIETCVDHRLVLG